MKSAKTKKKIDTSKYVNIETGELLSMEIPNITSVNQATDLVIVNSDEYVVVDSNARRFIEEQFNAAETGRIFQMCDMVKSYYNILSDKKKGEFHTKDTLMTELEYTRNKYADFMKKLFAKSVIYYIKGIKNDKECTWIMLNPTLARKSKTIHKDCLLMFENLSKKETGVKKVRKIKTEVETEIQAKE